MAVMFHSRAVTVSASRTLTAVARCRGPVPGMGRHRRADVTTGGSTGGDDPGDETRSDFPIAPPLPSAPPPAGVDASGVPSVRPARRPAADRGSGALDAAVRRRGRRVGRRDGLRLRGAADLYAVPGRARSRVRGWTATGSWRTSSTHPDHDPERDRVRRSSSASCRPNRCRSSSAGHRHRRSTRRTSSASGRTDGHATLGMRLLNLQVGNAFDGRKLDVGQAVRRWVALGGWLARVRLLHEPRGSRWSLPARLGDRAAGHDRHEPDQAGPARQIRELGGRRARRRLHGRHSRSAAC